jgi:hypothetical protein
MRTLKKEPITQNLQAPIRKVGRAQVVKRLIQTAGVTNKHQRLPHRYFSKISTQTVACRVLATIAFISMDQSISSM